MGPLNQEYMVLNQALEAVIAAVDAKAKALPFPKTGFRRQADALLEINLNGRKELFVAEIKTIDRRLAVAQIKSQLQILINEAYAGYHPLLITGFATPELAEECRKLGCGFLLMSISIPG